MGYEPDDAERELVQRVTDAFRIADDRHKHHREVWDRMFARYRTYQEMRASKPDRPDRDVRETWVREWGANLKLPIAFSIIETLTPRALAQAPRMLVLPRNPDAESNVRNMRQLIDAEQQDIDYELELQDVFKNGAIYGIGWQKTGWEKRYVQQRKLVKPISTEGWKGGEAERVCEFDGPTAEAIDPYDMLWDPFATKLDRCDYLIQRAWRSTRYVLDLMAAGMWKQIAEDDVKGMASMQTFSETQAERLRVQGITNWNTRGNELHEVWEFHERDHVVTVLDREAVVADRGNPYWHGQYPFQCYRPTKVPGQMVGLGEIEPIEHLIEEMDTFRSQRIDNATVALQRSGFFDQDAIDRDDLKTGPGLWIPVDASTGPVSEVFAPMPIHDIPNSSFQEMAELRQEVDRASGISDSVSGSEGGGTSETATGAQLVLAAANERIKLKRVRFEKEIIRPAARQWLRLNQQKITEKKSVMVKVEKPDPLDPEKRWTWLEVGPEELAGEMFIEPEGGSTAPENVPQKRADAQMIATFCKDNPAVKADKWVPHVLDLLGIREPESWLAPPDMVPAAVLELLVQNGVDEQLVAAAVQAITEMEQGGQPGVSPPPAAPERNMPPDQT